MKVKGMMLVFLGAASFGFTPIFVKTGFASGYSLAEINIAQMLCGVILLWMFCLFKGLTTRGMTKANVCKVMVTGTTVGLTSIFYYGAMQYLSASLAIILLFQFVWIGMIYEWVFSKSKPTRVNLISLAITLTGVVFASNVVHGKFFALPLPGLLLGILSGVSYAGFIYFSGQVATKSDPILRSALMVTGSMILVFVVFFKHIPTYPIYDGRLWMIGAGVALVGAIIPPLFFAGGAPLISGRLANVLSSVELPVAIISAMLILSESVTWLQWFGIMLILLAIVVNEMSGIIVNTKSRRKAS